MALENGNTVKIFIGIFTSAMLLLGSGVIANEVRNVGSHESITADYKQQDAAVLCVVNAIQIQQAVHGEILKRIEAKI